MRNNVLLKSVLVGACVGVVGMYGAYQLQKNTDSTDSFNISGNQGAVIAGHTSNKNMKIISAGSKTYVVEPVYSSNQKAQSRSGNEEKLRNQNKNYLKELNQYKQQEKEYKSRFEQLQKSVDSLEIVCNTQKTKMKTLEAYANEFHAMNKRYGNLPYKIEKDISTYLSKQE